MANGFEIEGKIHLINDIQTFPSGFSKREFVVETMDGQWAQMIKFECVKEKTALTDGLNQGDQVKVFFDIRGNEYNGKYYVNLNAWKLERAGAGNSSPTPSDPQPGDFGPPSEPPPGYGQATEDDIPF